MCLCVCSLDRALRDLKSRRSALITSLKNPTVEVVRPQRAGEKANAVLPGYQATKMSLMENLGLSNISSHTCCVCSSSAAAQSAPEDPKAAELASEIDRINRALDQCEKDILGRLRAPLDNRNPTQDQANRLQEQEVNMSHVML